MGVMWGVVGVLMGGLVVRKVVMVMDAVREW